MRDFVKNSTLTKMIALMTCVSFLSLIVNACGGPAYANDEPAYQESTTYRQPPPPQQYQSAPAVPQRAVVNMADSGMLSDYNECRYRMRVPLEQMVRMTSGRLCRNRNGVNRLVLASTDRSLTVPPGGRVESYDRMDFYLPPALQQPPPNVVVKGGGCDTTCKVLLGIGAGALLAMAIFFPLAAEAGWFDSGNGDVEIDVLTSPLMSF